MKIFRILILCSVFLISCLGKNRMESKVISQGNELARHLMRDELDAYLDKMAYFVYSNKAEREQLRENLIKEDEFSKARGADLIKAVSEKNSEIFEKDGYYQCIFKQKRYFHNVFATYTTDEYFLAISKDGEIWKFALITHIPISLVRKVFKEMHGDLDIIK